MDEPIFDHDRLDVYRLSIDYVAQSFAITKQLSGLQRHARDQCLRAAQSIPLNIAVGNGKRSLKDRNRFLDISFRCPGSESGREIGRELAGGAERCEK